MRRVGRVQSEPPPPPPPPGSVGLSAAWRAWVDVVRLSVGGAVAPPARVGHANAFALFCLSLSAPLSRLFGPFFLSFFLQIRVFCAENGIVYEAFWTLTANPHLLRSTPVLRAASRLEATPAQVSLSSLSLKTVFRVYMYVYAFLDMWICTTK